MSLLISGLNLPNDKPVTLFITSNRDVYLEGVLLAGKAVPVPPHGRLVDADALIKMAEPIKDFRGNVKCVVWDAHINRLPTIIPAEEETQ